MANSMRNGKKIKCNRCFWIVPEMKNPDFWWVQIATKVEWAGMFRWQLTTWPVVDVQSSTQDKCLPILLILRYNASTNSIIRTGRTTESVAEVTVTGFQVKWTIDFQVEVWIHWTTRGIWQCLPVRHLSPIYVVSNKNFRRHHSISKVNNQQRINLWPSSSWCQIRRIILQTHCPAFLIKETSRCSNSR